MGGVDWPASADFVGSDNAVLDTAWSSDGHLIATGTYQDVRLWDATSGKLVSTFPKQSSSVIKLAWSPNGRYLAVGRDQIVQLWEITTGRQTVTYRGHSDLVLVVVWSPDSKRLASAGLDDTVQVWDAKTGQTKETYRGHENLFQRYLLDQILKSSSRKAQNIMESPLTPREMLTSNTGSELPQDTGQTPSRVLALSWVPNGEYIASGGTDGTVQVWQPE